MWTLKYGEVKLWHMRKKYWFFKYEFMKKNYLP